MRFITEFELEPRPYDPSGVISAYKSRGEFDLGQGIGKLFEWEKYGSLIPGQLATLGYRLEIEAFPMDKWIEFKKRLSDALPDYDTVSRVRIIDALADLESSIGKEKLPG